MKFAAGFVLYLPEKEELERINGWASSGMFELCLVYDNSTESHKDELNESIVYYHQGQNNGLTKAYNSFIQSCVDKGIEYLCIMDQDSGYSIEELTNMQSFLKNNYESVKEYPIVAPRSYCDSSEIVERGERLTPADYVINSGTFLSIYSLEKNSLRYDENIFLDGVDYEFCMQVRQKGLKVMIYENSVLWQKLGYTREVKGKKVCCHSPIRYYYIVKARNYTNIKYYGKFKGGLRNLVKFFGTAANILKNEDQKGAKLKKIWSACFAK